MNTKKGCLSIVATPIGNLDDISARAIHTLKQADLIIAENIHHSKKLLKNFNINTQVWTYNDHNGASIADKIIQRLLSDDSVALISDAGTPLIADPGYRLVKLAHEHDIRVQPLPGPCALIAALCASGLPSDKFMFTGFFPGKQVARIKAIDKMQSFPHTWIAYESPHRISATLQDIQQILGPHRKMMLAREMTKCFETLIIDEVCNIISFIDNDPDQRKGEFVIVIHGREKKENTQINDEATHILTILKEELPLKKACLLTEKLTGISKRELYEYSIKSD